MFYYLIGLITGLFFGYLLKIITDVLNKGFKVRLFGYEISINKTRKAEVVNMDEKKSVDPKSTENKCEVCNDEDMFVAGTKNLIPCPECNRNRSRFKTL